MNTADFNSLPESHSSSSSKNPRASWHSDELLWNTHPDVLYCKACRVTPYLAKTEGVGISRVEAEPPALPRVLPYVPLSSMVMEASGITNKELQLSLPFQIELLKGELWETVWMFPSSHWLGYSGLPSQTLREQVASVQFSNPSWYPRLQSTIKDRSTAGKLLKIRPLLTKSLS